MAIADLIPNFTDVELANLNANVRRILETGAAAQKAAAADLAPLIDAQIAERLARKPAKAKAKPKAAAIAKAPKPAKAAKAPRAKKAAVAPVEAA
jgi:hypothetical protein